ncbi:MAG: PHP domain-containing protein [SAR202 cluster bacterium]|nr:PHP domain-containing protein [SAR202 cluster bacterium]
MDLHMHSHFSPDSMMSPERLVRRCEQVGLNCIAVTDHNTTAGALRARELAQFHVIIGEEVRSSEGEITGLFLDESIPAGLTPVETARRIKDQGGLVSVPHPFDRFRRSVITTRGLEEVWPHADIIEVFNARNNLDADNRKAREFAAAHDLIGSAVTDAHTVVELGRTYIEMPEFDGTPGGFKDALSQGALHTRKMTPLIHVATRFTVLYKKLFGAPPSQPNEAK